MGSTVNWASLKDARVGWRDIIYESVQECECKKQFVSSVRRRTKVFGLRRKYECYAVCVYVVWRVQGQDLHALCCPLVQDTAMKMSDCPKKEAQWLVLSKCTLCKRTAGILTAFRWGHSGWRSTRLPHCPSMKGSHWLIGGYWLEQNPHSILLCLPTFPHLHLYHHFVCVHETRWRVWVSTGLEGAR